MEVELTKVGDETDKGFLTLSGNCFEHEVLLVPKRVLDHGRDGRGGAGQTRGGATRRDDLESPRVSERVVEREIRLTEELYGTGAFKDADVMGAEGAFGFAT